MSAIGGVPPTLGIVGGGQLARMTYQAAISLGVPVVVLAASRDDAAAGIAREVVYGSPYEREALRELARRSTVVTFEHEAVAIAALAGLEAEGAQVRPGTATMTVATDKRLQRSLQLRYEIPAPRWASITSLREVEHFADAHGWPVVLKAARGGYDGRGVRVVDDAEAAEIALAQMGGPDRAVLAEQRVAMQCELAVVVVRSLDGEVRSYPVVETVQVGGMCREVVLSERIHEDVDRRARAVAERLATLVGAVGVLAVELFVDQDGEILVNEIAARPHNSGHFTIEGASTSQFENHVRAVLGLPLGDTSASTPVVVSVNVVASSSADPRAGLWKLPAVPGVRVHLYAKEARPGRKVGHVTALGTDLEETRMRAHTVASALGNRTDGVAARNPASARS